MNLDPFINENIFINGPSINRNTIPCNRNRAITIRKFLEKKKKSILATSTLRPPQKFLLLKLSILNYIARHRWILIGPLINRKYAQFYAIETEIWLSRIFLKKIQNKKKQHNSVALRTMYNLILSISSLMVDILHIKFCAISWDKNRDLSIIKVV